MKISVIGFVFTDERKRIYLDKKSHGIYDFPYRLFPFKEQVNGNEDPRDVLSDLFISKVKIVIPESKWEMIGTITRPDEKICLYRFSNDDYYEERKRSLVKCCMANLFVIRPELFYLCLGSESIISYAINISFN